MNLKTVVCESCGSEVNVSQDKGIIWCTNRDCYLGIDRFWMETPAAFFNDNEWHSPSSLLESDKDGIIKAKSTSEKDKHTLRYLSLLAMMAEPTFTYVDLDDFEAWFLWDKGEIVGYLVKTNKLSRKEGVFVLAQIFVRREFRRIGYGTQMMFWVRLYCTTRKWA